MNSRFYEHKRQKKKKRLFNSRLTPFSKKIYLITKTAQQTKLLSLPVIKYYNVYKENLKKILSNDRSINTFVRAFVIHSCLYDVLRNK